MMMKIKKQSGLTLIEMMIAMLLGLLVTGAIIAIFISNVKSSSENIKMIHLNQELRGVMGFMSDELKRAGYSASSDGLYMAAFGVFDSDGDGVDDCIIYAYDENGDGSVYSSPSDNSGFKLDGNIIRWKKNVTNCSTGTWEPLTASTIADITVFDVSVSDIQAGTITIHQLNIALTGQVALNPGVAARTITETIRVRNEDAS